MSTENLWPIYFCFGITGYLAHWVVQLTGVDFRAQLHSLGNNLVDLTTTPCRNLCTEDSPKAIFTPLLPPEENIEIFVCRSKDIVY